VIFGRPWRRSACWRRRSPAIRCRPPRSDSGQRRLPESNRWKWQTKRSALAEWRLDSRGRPGRYAASRSGRLTHRAKRGRTDASASLWG
jgi:hypothetical protein